MNFVTELSSKINSALRATNPADFESVFGVISDAARKQIPIVVMGNGGSAAVAEHLSCDWTKGVAQKKTCFPRVHSLVSNQSLITAIANDYGYEHIFSKQIEYLPYHQCIVLGVSSSGNSLNIVNGFIEAANRKYVCIALVGFNGGIVVKEHLALGLTVHVKSDNYGIVEDSHSIIMHAIADRLKSIA